MCRSAVRNVCAQGAARAGSLRVVSDEQAGKPCAILWWLEIILGDNATIMVSSGVGHNILGQCL